MQAQVQRVQHEAAARDAEVRLVVLVVVPAERRDPVAALEAELLQRDRELPCAPHRVLVRRAVEALVGEPRDDLAVAVVRLRAPQQVRQRQLEVHHQAVHGAPRVAVDGCLQVYAVTGAPITASAISARSAVGRAPMPSSQSARL